METLDLKSDGRKKWKVAGAFIQGIGHKKSEIPCQDKTYHAVNRTVAVISLADGAGSRKFSHFGAEVVTKQVCMILKKRFDKLFAKNDLKTGTNIHTQLVKHLSLKAEALNIGVRELASTLLFVAVKDNRYMAGHIGDGVIGVLSRDGISVLSHPENGEYINIAYFVTTPNAVDHFRVYKGYLEDIEGFILMSDGVSKSLYSHQERRLSIESERILNWLENHNPADVKKALYQNLNEILGKRTTDDCSVCLLRRIEHKVETVKALDYQIRFPF